MVCKKSIGERETRTVKTNRETIEAIISDACLEICNLPINKRLELQITGRYGEDTDSYIIEVKLMEHSAKTKIKFEQLEKLSEASLNRDLKMRINEMTVNLITRNYWDESERVSSQLQAIAR